MAIELSPETVARAAPPPPRRPRRPRRSRTAMMLALALGSAVLWTVASAGGTLERLELQTVDARFAVRGAQPAPPEVATVLLDSRTLDTLRERPPLPRSRHATVIERLHEAGARLIVMDFVFTEQTEAAEDDALIESLMAARPTVLGASEVDQFGATNVLGGADAQAEFGVAVGSVNFPLDPSGVYRRVPHSVERLKSLAVVAAETARESSSTRSASVHGMWIDYAAERPCSVALVRRRAERALRSGRGARTRRRGGRVGPDAAGRAPDVDERGHERRGDPGQRDRTVLRGGPLRDAPWWAGRPADRATAFASRSPGCASPRCGAEAVARVRRVALSSASQVAFTAAWSCRSSPRRRACSARRPGRSPSIIW